MLKTYYVEILAGLTLLLNTLGFLRDKSKDVPPSTKDFVDLKLKEYKLADIKERESRIKGHEDRQKLNIKEALKEGFEEYDKTRTQIEGLHNDLISKDVDFLREQFDGVHKRLDLISENCTLHKKGKR